VGSSAYAARTNRQLPRRRARARILWPALALAALAACLPSSPAGAAQHFACSGPHAAITPCQFSTPSGNIHCLWLPNPNSVSCELLASGRAYLLQPTGKAHKIHLKLKSRGETLPTNQQLIFPRNMSCHDTKTTMTCNQDFGRGFFKLAPKGSRSA
jgi:hypothetical protein